MMKIISHKVVIVYQYINVDVDLLLVCLGAWLLFCNPCLNSLGLFMFAPCIFESRKVKVVRNGKKTWNQSYNVHQKIYIH